MEKQTRVKSKSEREKKQLFEESEGGVWFWGMEKQKQPLWVFQR